MNPLNHRPARERRRTGWGAALCVGAALTTAAGCYDGAELVERVRSKAIRTRLEEVDLGRYRITLPRDPIAGETVELRVRLFAHAARHKISGIEDQLEEKSFLLNDNMMIAFRSIPRSEYDDPDLTRVRTEVLDTVNALLDEPLLSELGLYQFELSRQ